MQTDLELQAVIGFQGKSSVETKDKDRPNLMKYINSPRNY